MAENHDRTTFSNHIITDNLARVRGIITDTCSRCGRIEDEVRLIAVSKTKPLGAVRTAIEGGQLDFGENQLQDALTKIPHFENTNLTWHLIGPLQSNKAKLVPGNFNWWHTLNRVDIAQRVSNKALEIDESINALIQVNMISDPAKSGVLRGDLTPLVEQLLESELKGVCLRGLMTIGPHGGSEPELRECFSKLRQLQETIRQQLELPEFDQLSMGMTNDMAPAIAEGATMVRVGSAIFGARK